MNSRYYSPEFGRFISADVFISTGQGLQGANMFAYCGNNPVNKADPNGKLANWIIGGIVGAIIGGASSAINDAIMGREVTIGSVLHGAVTGFVSGVVSSIVPTDGAAALLSATTAYIGSRMSGVGIGESLVVAATTGIATYATRKLCKRTIGRKATGLTKNVGEGMIGFYTSGYVEAWGSIGRGVYVSCWGKESTSASQETNSSDYSSSFTQTIHGGGRWTCKAMAL